MEGLMMRRRACRENFPLFRLVCALVWTAVGAETQLKYNVLRCDSAESLPTTNASNAVAVIIRGDSFRGLTHGIVIAGSKRWGVCDAKAHAIQGALSRSHVKDIIEPFEQRGLRVDVFLATYACTSRTDPATIAAVRPRRVPYTRDLSTWYGGPRAAGGRVVGVHARDPNSPDAKQSTIVEDAMRLLRLHWPENGYRQVLLWRFDLVSIKRPRLSCTDGPLSPVPFRASSQPWAQAKVRPPTRKGCSEFDNYFATGSQMYMFVADDWGHSFPGYMAHCAVPILERGCMRGGIESPLCTNLMLDSVNRTPQFSRILGPGVDLHIYRSDFKTNNMQSGSFVCRTLRDEFAGPPCPQTDRDGRVAACRSVAAALSARAPTGAVRPYKDNISWKDSYEGFCVANELEIVAGGFQVANAH